MRKRMLRHNAIEAWVKMLTTGWRDERDMAVAALGF